MLFPVGYGKTMATKDADLELRAELSPTGQRKGSGFRCQQSSSVAGAGHDAPGPCLPEKPAVGDCVIMPTSQTRTLRFKKTK
jgi:hypothetical protein